MNKRIITAILLLTCLAFCPFTTSADYPSGSLDYSDEIAVDAEFEWTVKTLEKGGDNTYYAVDDTFYVGDAVLEQGDKIKLVVLEDPDDAIGVWYDIYVDGVKVINPDDYWLGYGTFYAYSDFFVSPVTYTNATGTYNLYEQILEEFEVIETDYSTVYTSGSVIVGYTERFAFSLTGTTFTTEIYMERFTQIGDDYLKVKYDLETSVNIQTGLLGHTQMFFEFTMYESGITETTYANIFIDSKYTGIPFSWVFSFMSIFFIASVVALVKRKRK